MSITATKIILQTKDGDYLVPITGLEEQIGNLSLLETTVKTDLVSAINEVKENSSSGSSSLIITYWGE